MKFLCQCKTLREEVENAYLFVGQKNALSIQSNVFLSVDGGLLTLKTYDQNSSGFSSSFEVKEQESGKTTVFCEKLLSLLKSLPDIEIEVSTEGEKLRIKDFSSNKIVINLNTIASDKFPSLKESESPYFPVAQKDFIDMIDKTAFAVSDDTARKFLNGVYLEKKGKSLVMVATDGRKLAIVEREGEKEIPDFSGSILNVKFLNAVKTIASGEGELFISLAEGESYARIGRKEFYVPLIPEDYPKYSRVIPKDLKYKAIVKREEFDKALTLASNLIENKSRKIFVSLKKDVLTVEGEASEGNVNATMGCSYDGPDTTITFNCSVIQGPVKRIKSEFFALNFSDPSSSMTFTPDPESDYLYVVMPMKV